MTYDKKLNQFQIAQTNKYNVFRCLVREGPISRSAIARHMGLSIPTVMAIVDDLFGKKVIRSEGKAGNGVGKQPEILAVEPGCYYYIGVDIGRSTLRVVVNNAAGELAGSMKEPTGDTLPAKEFISHVKKLTLRFVKKLKIDSSRVLGAGIAMPGLIELETGKVMFAPDFGWQDIPLREWLQKRVPYPIMVKNSTQAMAVNETYTPDNEEIHATLCVNLGYGIGAAVISDEGLYNGTGGISGELGHCLVEPNGPLCKCGNRGCLEAVSSGEAIARQAREQAGLAEGKSLRAALSESCGGDLSKLEAKAVFDAAASGDSLAQTIVKKAANYIGIGISMAVNILDCDRVVVCGGLMRNGPQFLEQIKASMEDHLVARASRSLILSAGANDEYSTAKGASRVLINTLWARRELPV